MSYRVLVATENTSRPHDVEPGSAQWIPATDLPPSGGGSRWQVTWTPGATDDPDTGLYGTFSDAHAAAADIAAAGLDVDIVVGSSGGSYEIEAGTYDMARLALIGYPAFEPLASIALVVNTAAAGVTFTNFTRGISYMTLRHDGSDPLCELTADSSWVSLGHVCVWRSTAGLLWDVTGGAAHFTFGDQVSLGAAEDVGVGLVNVDAGAVVIYWCTTNDTVRDVTTGAGQLTVAQGSGSSDVADQTGHSGAFTITSAIKTPVAPVITLRPGGGDPGNGVYETWAEAYTACANLGDRRVLLLVDNPGGVGSALTIPNGTYDMANIVLRGFDQATQSDGTPTHWLITSATTVFQNFINGISYLALAHTGASPLATVALSGVTAIPMGPYAFLTTSTAEMFRFTGTGVGTFLCESFCTFGGVGSGGYELINQTGNSTLSAQVNGGAVEIDQDALRGVAGATFGYGGFIGPLQTQANYAGTITPGNTAAEVLYTANNPADWNGSPPTTVAAALDRIAAALGPIT